MKDKQRGFMPILITIIVSVIATSGVGYGVYKYNEVKKENTELKEEVFTSQSEQEESETEEVAKEEEELSETKESQTEIKVTTPIIQKIDPSVAIKYQNEVNDFINLSKERITYLEDIIKSYEELLINESMSDLRELWLLAIEDTNTRIKLYATTIVGLNELRNNILEVGGENEAREIVDNSEKIYYTIHNKEKSQTEEMIGMTADILFAKGDYLFGDLFED